MPPPASDIRTAVTTVPSWNVMVPGPESAMLPEVGVASEIVQVVAVGQVSMSMFALKYELELPEIVRWLIEGQTVEIPCGAVKVTSGPAMLVTATVGPWMP